MSENQMQEANGLRVVEVLVYSWGHGLSSKRAVMKDIITLIKRQLKKTSPDLDYIHTRLDILERVAEELTEFESPYRLEKTQLHLLIKDRLEQLQRRPSYESVDFVVDTASPSATINVNPLWLRRILDIVVDNAIDAMEDSKKKQITISTSVDEREVNIRVSDTGKGIDPNLVPHLFKKPSVVDQRNRGRGLFIAKLLVDIYDGDIAVIDTGPKGTTVAIRLPLVE